MKSVVAPKQQTDTFDSYINCERTPIMFSSHAAYDVTKNPQKPPDHRTHTATSTHRCAHRNVCPIWHFHFQVRVVSQAALLPPRLHIKTARVAFNSPLQKGTGVEMWRCSIQLELVFHVTHEV